jgi:purine catabolism regulator
VPELDNLRHHLVQETQTADNHDHPEISLPPRLRTITALPELGLRVLAAERALDREVSWVAVSELEDPTPFLEGGELLLTTGMRLPRDAAAIRGYVNRLAERGVVGVGLGVGLGHDSAPPALVRAATRRGLALLEVPRPTPFIAISKAVSSLLAAEQHEAARRAFEAQRELTRAALRPERSAAVVSRLARLLSGWAVLLDVAGQPVHASPASAANRAAGLRDELEALRAKGLLASSAVANREGQIVLHPLGAQGRTRGFLVIGVAHPLSAMDRAVANTAISLLSLDLEKSRTQVLAERQLRHAAVQLLLAGAAEPVRGVAGLVVGGFPSEPTRVVVVEVPSSAREAVLDAIEDDVRLRSAAVLTVLAAEPGDPVHGVLVVAPADEQVLTRLVAVVEPAPDRIVGIGGPVQLTELARSLVQAKQALAAARRGGATVVRYEEMAGSGLLGLLDNDAVRGFSAALLGPLDAHGSGRTDLVASLRAFLAHNGQWDPAAAELGVHRHTLRYRMRRVAELLGRDVDSADTRMELWLALQARDQLAASRNAPRRTIQPD